MCLATACLVLSLNTRSEAKTKSKAKKSNEQDTFRVSEVMEKKVRNINVSIEKKAYILPTI